MLLYGEEMFVALGIGVERKEGWGLINVDCLITAMNKVEEEGGLNHPLHLHPGFLFLLLALTLPLMPSFTLPHRHVHIDLFVNGR